MNGFGGNGKSNIAFRHINHCDAAYLQLPLVAHVVAHDAEALRRRVVVAELDVVVVGLRAGVLNKCHAVAGIRIRPDAVQTAVVVVVAALGVFEYYLTDAVATRHGDGQARPLGEFVDVACARGLAVVERDGDGRLGERGDRLTLPRLGGVEQHRFFRPRSHGGDHEQQEEAEPLNDVCLFHFVLNKVIKLMVIKNASGKGDRPRLSPCITDSLVLWASCRPSLLP